MILSAATFGRAYRPALTSTGGAGGDRPPASPGYHPPMDDLAVRATALLRMLVPFVFFMASVYLTLHIVLARFIAGNRPSGTLWFFSIVTGPLTRPVRAMLPPGTSESRVRALALALYVGLWIFSRIALGPLGPAGG